MKAPAYIFIEAGDFRENRTRMELTRAVSGKAAMRRRTGISAADAGNECFNSL